MRVLKISSLVIRARDNRGRGLLFRRFGGLILSSKVEISQQAGYVLYFCTEVRNDCPNLAQISRPTGVISNLKAVIHKHLATVADFAVLTKRRAGSHSEPQNYPHTQTS